ANGYFYPEEISPAKHPFYFAGLYYLQEPSAMTPASLLPVAPGNKVLDLCAAPGGKSTELAAKLCGKGVLVANDISNSRAKALLKNIELFGVKNAVVVSEAPGKLAERFGGYFDRILVDAPCSGEGMFRKSPAIMKNWEQYGTGYYNELQKQILPEAVKMLAPGGYLLYSTCTFSPDEDEGTVQFLLEQFPEMELVPALPQNAPEGVCYDGMEHGRPEWVKNGDERLRYTLRLWPHKIKGEGHFIALFHKKEDASVQKVCSVKNVRGAKLSGEAQEFINKIGFVPDAEQIVNREGRLYLLPEGLPALDGLRILRSGLLLGEEKKGRFEPSQALAMALKKEEYPQVYSLSEKDCDVIRYLKCESIEAHGAVPDGYVLVCVGDYPLGWAKANKGGLKNK
ncbi:MAG: RsmB/NOP family class I SAM-dependent RNA methyltransferase, partial [Lachnospiraceae bacterium]|nr:RsmB/NOP family class I SAM-dependent RNA methyltransferase [Lachnospiraceae bacterium]